MNYLYLHGFASGPQSAKAVYLRDRFAEQGLDLQIPDLNQADFSTLTLTRQLRQCEGILNSQSGPWTVLGSSLGGFTAAWLGQTHPLVERMVLLAPAFDFLGHWQQQLGPEKLQQWQQSDMIEVFHHAVGRSLPLRYQFWEDAEQYTETHLQRPVPTLIFHGMADEVIPIAASRTYAAQRSWCRLIELPSDHGLLDTLPKLWTSIQSFCILDR
ncbi:MAG: YqiA/YcfP family alpha/beta fold hydrolase [Thermosynechococcaceae cyanobacterium]